MSGGLRTTVPMELALVTCLQEQKCMKRGESAMEQPELVEWGEQ